MKTIAVRSCKQALLFALAAAVPLAAGAQSPDSYPSRPVKLVVGFAPGGPTDVVARLIADKASGAWGQQMIVENRPGAGGNIAADIVAKSPADGYTLVLGVTGSHSINPATRKDLPYHPLKDFEPITQVAQFANAIAAHPSFPANSLQELIALAKRDPGKLLYGTDGVGTASHLTMALLASKAGIKLGAVPYKGATPMLTELLGGQVQLGITGLPAMQTHAKAGKLKLLAVTTPQRVASNPDVPTIAEQGFPGFAAAPWSGFLAPRGTPRAIIDKLSTDLAKVMHLPDVQEKMASQGISVVTNRPEEFRAFLENQLQQWAEAARLAGLEPQ